jgi:cytidylate kinase
VNQNESAQEQMRATIKRLSIENQRLKVNYHIDAKDIKDKDLQLHQKDIDDANR